MTDNDDQAVRYACRKGHHERCNGDWCDCPCHQLPADGAEPDRAVEYERRRRAHLASIVQPPQRRLRPDESVWD